MTGSVTRRVGECESTNQPKWLDDLGTIKTGHGGRRALSEPLERVLSHFEPIILL